MVEVERKEGKRGEEDEEWTGQLFCGQAEGAQFQKRERFKARQSGRLEKGELESRITGSNAGLQMQPHKRVPNDPRERAGRRGRE